VKRLGLGPKFYDSGVSIPELVEQPDGPYVTHADYLKLLHLATLREAVNKVLEAEVEQLLAEQEAIGAAPDLLEALQAVVDAAGPDSGPEIGMAEAAIKKATGGQT